MGYMWVAELADFNFSIRYRPGKQNIDADALSRLPVNPMDYMESCTKAIAKDEVDAVMEGATAQRDELHACNFW